MFNYYSLYSLSVQSTIPLPAPVAAAAADPVIIESITTPPAFPEFPADKNYLYDVNCIEAQFWYQDVAIFTILGGEKIIVQPAPGVDENFLSATIIGTPMGILFLQRGYFVLHGSAVEVDGKVVVFLGASCSGKSTAALSLVAAGCSLVTDDVVVVDQKVPAEPTVIPALPWMKVDEKAAAAVGIDGSSLQRPGPAAHKDVYHLAPGQFVTTDKPLAAVFLPVWGDSFSIKELSPREAMIAIAPHSYGPAPRTKYPEETAKYFANAADLVSAVPCFTLTRPYALGRLNELVPLIANHIELVKARQEAP